MKFIKKLFSNSVVQIVSCILLLAMVLGAAALMLPAAQKVADTSDCLHARYRLVSKPETSGGQYSFRCSDCRAVIRETPSTSQFVLHKPTIVDGVVTMISPWEIGAYYNDGYRLFTKKATDDWYTDGTLWETSTGVRVRDTYVSMTSSSYGDAAITYIAEADGFVRPYFTELQCYSAARNCEFAIYLNGKPVAPADGNFVYSSTSTEREYMTDAWNEELADSWISVKKGDKISFVIVFTGTESTEFLLQPAIEFLHYSPNRK